MKAYGWSAPRLADAYTTEELMQLRDQVQAQHLIPKAEQSGPWLYDKAGRKKLEVIGYAIYYKAQERKSA